MTDPGSTVSNDPGVELSSRLPSPRNDSEGEGDADGVADWVDATSLSVRFTFTLRPAAEVYEDESAGTLAGSGGPS